MSARDRVAVIGVGGLGGPAARGLVHAGVPVTLFDGDVIEVHNLPRQTLFRDAEIGEPKPAAAARRLRETIPGADIEVVGERVTERNVALLERHRLWLDATDQLASKLFFSDQAVARNRTLVHGGAVRLGGQVLGVVPGAGPCLRCLLDVGAEGETCQSAGILGPVVALLGVEMAQMALRWLRGVDIAGSFVAFDAKQATLRSGRLARRESCEACGILTEDFSLVPDGVPAESSPGGAEAPPSGREKPWQPFESQRP